MYAVNNLSKFPLVSSIICFAVILYMSIKGEKTAKLYSLLFLLFCVLLWSFGQFLEYSTANIHLILQYTKILHTGVAFLGTACFLFSLCYVDSPLIAKYFKALPILFIIPAVVVISLYTNELHWLFLKIEPLDLVQRTYIRELGIFYWVETISNYVFVFLSVLTVMKSILNSGGELRKQRIILAIVLTHPTFSAMLFDLIGAVNKGITTSFDITPTSFSISLLLLVIATFKYSFLDIVPITLKKIFYNMKDAIVIINKHNRVLKYNSSFVQYFGAQNKFEYMEDILQYLAKYQVDYMPDSNFHRDVYGEERMTANYEIQIKGEKDGKTKIFDVSIQPVNNPPGLIIGRIITFCDITVYKELAAENERNHIALEIHDSIGYGLTNLIMFMKGSKISYAQNPDTVDNIINTTLSIAEKMLIDLRYTVSDLKPHKEYDIVNAIDSLAEYIRSMGITVDIKVIGEEQYQAFKRRREFLYIPDALYRICREAVTNSLCHGKASEIKIIMKFLKEAIQMYIVDNGQGCKEIKKGIGLLGMEERVKGIGGRVTYGSSDENGFCISILVPLTV